MQLRKICLPIITSIALSLSIFGFDSSFATQNTQAYIPAAVKSHVIVKSSKNDFSNTQKKLKEWIKHNGFKLHEVIDHQKLAKKVDIKLNKFVTFMVGKPIFGSTLINANPVSALLVPVQIAIWQDNNGKVKVAYWDNDSLSTLTNRPSMKVIAIKFQQAMSQMTDAATK